MYGVSWSFGRVNSSTLVSSAKFTEIRDYINTERARRTYGATYPGQSNPINSEDFNQLRDALNVGGQGSNTFYNDFGGGGGTITSYTHGGVGAPSLPAYRAHGEVIYGSYLNDLMTSLEQAAAVCLCNCNYCTCNCNYCTCNCNYSCTCNCNYSDRRLKHNIKYIGMYGDLKIYTFKYLNSDQRYAGIMAQDLIGTKYQGALSFDKNGYYVVDYGMLPVKMTEV